MDLLAKIQAKEPGFENIHFLEVMACPGGCIGGAGTVMPITKSKAAILQSQKQSTKAHSYESTYEEWLDELAERD